MWRVLIVEDEYFIALEVEQAFVEAGAHVVGPVCTLAELLDQPWDSFDAAVLDVQLQDGVCYPFAAKLLEAGIPFVFATGYERAQLGDAFESIPCLVKPFSGEALVDALRARAATLSQRLVPPVARPDQWRTRGVRGRGPVEGRRGRAHGSNAV